MSDPTDPCEQIATALGNQNLTTVAGNAIRGAINYVLDGDCYEDLEGCVKTFIGTKFEKYFVRELQLPYGKHLKLDTVIAGYDVDIKLTMGKTWMIPPECVDEHCLLCKVDYNNQVFSLGLLHANAGNLTIKGNRDQKRSVSSSGKQRINWMIVDQPIVA